MISDDFDVYYGMIIMGTKKFGPSNYIRYPLPIDREWSLIFRQRSSCVYCVNGMHTQTAAEC